MTPAEKKVVDRIEKLLRLAAPGANNSEPERVSAALEAAKLFAENNLSVQPRVRRARATRPRARAPEWSPPPQPMPAWQRAVATRRSRCSDPDCGQPIYPGDAVWARREDEAYIHLGGDCGWF